jgi:hypothetical protein
MKWFSVTTDTHARACITYFVINVHVPPTHQHGALSSFLAKYVNCSFSFCNSPTRLPFLDPNVRSIVHVSDLDVYRQWNIQRKSEQRISSKSFCGSQSVSHLPYLCGISSTSSRYHNLTYPILARRQPEAELLHYRPCATSPTPFTSADTAPKTTS